MPAGAAILLCAGGGSRFTGDAHKLLQPLNGSNVFELALRAMLEAGLEANIVIDGAIDVSEYVGPGVIRLHNERWQEGMATSLALALDHARSLGYERAVVGLGDQPGILKQSWRKVADSDERPIAVATYHGKRRNPVGLDSSVWDLLPKSGDEGARVLLRAYPELVKEVDCLGDPRDIDTVEDLIKWNS